MPTQPLFTIIDIKAFNYADWLSDSSTTPLDAIMTILFHRHGKPCLELNQTIDLSYFFDRHNTERNVDVNLPGDNGMMRISRYANNRVRFGTSRPVRGLAGLTVQGRLLPNFRVDWIAPIGPNISGTAVSVKEIAADMLKCLQSLDKLDYDHTKGEKLSEGERGRWNEREGTVL